MSIDMAKYLKGRVTIDSSGCWLWTDAPDPHGYGRIRLRTSPHRNRNAHCVSYETFVGSIPDGLQLDHLCRVRHCINPEHLEPVTSRENTLRGSSFGAVNAAKTHCKRNHAFTPENTYMWRRSRHCRTCRLARRAVQS